MRYILVSILLCRVFVGFSQDPVLLHKDSAAFQLNYRVEAAGDWDLLFKRNHGWFGGDGIYSIPMNGIETQGREEEIKTLFIFSDTMFGDIREGELQPGSKMVNNSVAILTGRQPRNTNMLFYGDDQPVDSTSTLFAPKTVQSKEGEYYWLGDGFVNQALDFTTYIFGYRIRNTGAKVFGFEEVGNTLIAIPKGSEPPFSDYRQFDTPLYVSKDDNQQKGSFGAGILVNTELAGVPNPDGFIYVYGVMGSEKKVLVARVRPEDFEAFEQWRYWDGTKWDADINGATEIVDRASNELSVSPLDDGRYVMVFQKDGIGSSVGLRVGLSPVGPFGPIHEIWQCPEPAANKNYFVYNAKAHPHLSEKGELLISYNVNSFDFLKDLNLDPQLYRPRFIRIKFDQ